MTSASSMHEAGHSKLVLWDKPGEWGEERDGRRVQDGVTHVHHGLFMLMYNKTTTIL